jgi:pyridoxal phosphate enzyme (YggS family)
VSAEREIAAALAAVYERIARAAERAGRSPETIALVGVSKRKSAEQVAAAVRAGLRHVGENYVQEAAAKLPEIRALLAASGHAPPRWHFIGRLQRNKAAAVARDFDCIETVDRERLGHELDRRADQRAAPLEVLLQVNLSGEAGKGGVAPAELPALLAASRHWPRLRAIGLMAIPAPEEDPEASRPAFAELRRLRDSLRGEPGGEGLTQLSMGMSLDFEVAIEEGATIVRVGTAIFGAR